MTKLVFAISSAILFSTAYAQPAKSDKKWDVNNPSGPFKEVSFTVNEGTWMNLDLSPDGKEIVFDMLGDIYTIPFSGGTAKVLRKGLAYEVQPKYSPDGKKILFTSDAGGGDNIWIMDKDGSNAKQITKENFRLLNNAQFTPDGQYIVARKHFTAGRSLGAGELWMYHISGGGGLQLTARKNDQQDLNEPAVSPDGRYIYYSEDVYPGGYFQYNKDPNNQIFAIKRFDREKGVIENVTGGPGGAFRPQLSHDGKTLAFIKRVRTKTVLYLRNLETGEEWPVYDSLSKDQQEAWTIFGIYTRYAFTNDDKNIVIWSNGKFIKIDLEKTNSATEIPFTVNATQRITDAVRFQQKINTDQFTANVIRHATASPDGKWLVFNATGYLWKKQLPNGTPQRITNGKDFEFEPSFSADGKNLLYVTWNDENTGAINTIPLVGGQSKKLTQSKGIYRTPSYSNDGQKIVFQREGGNDIFGNGYTTKPGIYWMNADGSSPTFITGNGSHPRFNKSGKKIYFLGGNNLGECDLDGNNVRAILKSAYGSQFTVSPDGDWVAFVDLHKVYVAAFPHTGKLIDINTGGSDFPVKLVSRDAGINLHWSSDSKQLNYTLGDQYYSIKLAERFEFIAGQPDSSFKMPEKGIAVGLKVNVEKPTGSIAFTNARIITMKGDEVIEKGTILIEGNIIKAVGTNVSIPAGAKIIDAAGQTIMPGMVDAHAHGNHFGGGLFPQKHWPYYTNLAYGVTTMHDPSANSELVLGQSELIKAGLMVGPRVFSTGTVLYGADGDFKAVINSFEDAKSALRRSKAYGAFSVKSYNQPRREQRQMIIEAARELEMEVVPEGGSFFYHNMSMINDGHTTIEHNIPIATLYSDVINLWKNSASGYTPTHIVSYGAPSGEYYWYQKTDVWTKDRLLRFTPRNIIDTRSRFRTMVPDEEYENGHILVSKSSTKLANAGVKVNLGAHGQIQGIGAHWELWMLNQGGMSNLQTLRSATLSGAQSLGLDQSIGSLEVGKLADLLVLEKNPLEDIHNSEFIKYTMVNGHLYDAATMTETGNAEKAPTKFWWQLNKSSQLGWHDETATHTEQCMCGRH
jgi:Tol biopolymer transport system component/imidazolonepropionase-like amidohydrolase